MIKKREGLNLRYFILYVLIATTCEWFFINKSIVINSVNAEDIKVIQPETSFMIEGKSSANQGTRFYFCCKIDTWNDVSTKKTEPPRADY